MTMAPDSAQRQPAAMAIEVSRLSRHFGDFVAVDSLDFGVAAGEVFGFLGANGAGKTTAIKMLIGLLKPSSGTAMVAGHDVINEPEKVRQRIGYMSQRFSLYQDLTVGENIELYGRIYGLARGDIDERRSKLLADVSLEQHADTLVGSIPLGWKQKLAFAVALLHRPSIVFLDEPTGGVDPVTRRQFWELIYAAATAGTTVFVTTHYLDEAEYCDRLSIMVAGQIKALGSPTELKQEYQTESINDIFVRLATAPDSAGVAT